MENNVLLGATETAQYDGSGVFNPNTPNADADPGYIPTESNDGANDTTGGGGTTTTSSNSGILLYAGLALAAYFFFFKKK
jgi:hypothetical protein